MDKQKELNELLDSLDGKAYLYVREWLFKKANSFAPDEKALHLHRTCNALIPVVDELNPNYFIHYDGND